MPHRGAFRIKAVTATGMVDLVTTWVSEEQAVEQLRLLQLVSERLALQALAAEDGSESPSVQADPAAGQCSQPSWHDGNFQPWQRVT